MASVLLSTLALLAVSHVRAETHTISFNNQCGKGTPMLIQGGNVLSKGEPYTHQGQFSAGIAYLQTGECGFNGDNCALLEMTLTNPVASAIGSGSSTDISLIPDHKLNVPVGFNYKNGCENKGTYCSTANCKTAFFVPDDNQVQVQCQDDNVDLVINFCTEGGGSSDPSPSSSSSSSKTTPSPTAAAAKQSPSPSPVVHAASSSSSSASAVAPSETANKNQCASRKSRRSMRRVPSPSAGDSAEALYALAARHPDQAADAAARALRAHRRHSHH